MSLQEKQDRLRKMLEDSEREEQVWDALPEAELLGRLVDRAYPVNHTMRALFFPIIHPADDAPPTLEELKGAMTAFYGLPVDEQKRVLNGWEPWGNRFDYDHDVLRYQVADQTTNYGFIARVLQIVAVGNEERWLGPPCASQELRYCAGVAPVEVTIKEGTSKDAALEALAAVVDTIRGQWDSLIKGVPALMPNAQ